eukprot:3808314-Rhodomonas_salina.1
MAVAAQMGSVTLCGTGSSCSGPLPRSSLQSLLVSLLATTRKGPSTLRAAGTARDAFRAHVRSDSHVPGKARS